MANNIYVVGDEEFLKLENTAIYFFFILRLLPNKMEYTNQWVWDKTSFGFYFGFVSQCFYLAGLGQVTRLH